MAKPTEKTIMHMSIDIRGALRWNRGMLRRLLLRDDGSTASADEALEFLLDDLGKGRKMLPIGTPCEGFSYETGCPGHR